MHVLPINSKLKPVLSLSLSLSLFPSTVADTKEFDALALALEKMAKEIEAPENKTLDNAVTEGEADAKSRRTRAVRKRKNLRGTGNRGKKKKDRNVQLFMKAAKFVRGLGAGA